MLTVPPPAAPAHAVERRHSQTPHPPLFSPLSVLCSFLLSVSWAGTDRQEREGPLVGAGPGAEEAVVAEEEAQ
eukprot:936484-Rhodomonas_salina.1